MSLKRWMTAAALLVASGARIAAQDLEIGALEQRALAGSPTLAAASARWAATLAAAEAAGVLADPELQLWLRNAVPGLTGSDAMGTSLEVEVVQPLPFPGKRQARRDVAAAAAAVAGTELVAARAELIAELRQTFAELASADREQRALAEAHEMLELLEATVTTRLGTGQQGALDVLEAQLEISRHDQMIDQVFARFLAARARVAALAGVRAEELPLRVEELPVPEFPVAEGPLPVEAERSPRVALAALALAAAERRWHAAELELRPDFGVGGGFEWPEGSEASLTLRFGMDLPFLRRRRLGPLVRAAEQEVVAARAELAAARLDLAAESVRLGAERDRFETTLKRLWGAIVPRSSAALDAARVAFLNGRETLPRVLALYGDWFEARIEIARAEAGRYAVWAEWQRWVGDLPAETAAKED